MGIGTAWPFRSRWLKTGFVLAILIMMAAALFGLVSAFIARDFGPSSLAALTVGLGALLIAAAFLFIEFMTRKWHPETGLFHWSDVDQLRALGLAATDEETRAWALSLADRIAVVLPGR